MNLGKIWKIAEVLVLSAVRARRGNSKNPVVEAKSGLRNAKITVVGFPVVSFLTYFFLIRGEVPLEIISGALAGVCVSSFSQYVLDGSEWVDV